MTLGNFVEDGVLKVKLIRFRKVNLLIHQFLLNKTILILKARQKIQFFRNSTARCSLRINTL